MRKTLIALYVAAALAAMAGCGQGTPDQPVHTDNGGMRSFLCIEGFTYVTYAHGLAPVFDKETALPKRCN